MQNDDALQRLPAEVADEIGAAIGRIRFGSVLIQIQDGVVVQIEATEKRRFAGRPQQSPKHTDY
jgi:hypothetical protein